MARGSDVDRFLRASIRAMARYRREPATGERRRLRTEEAASRALQRKVLDLAKRQSREAAEAYQAAREDEAREETEAIAARVKELQGVLAATLDVDDTIDFAALRVVPDYPELTIPVALAEPAVQPTEWLFLADVPKPHLLARLVPGAKRRHERSVDRARAAYQAALGEWRAGEEPRKAKLGEVYAEHRRKCQQIDASVARRNAEIDALEKSYRDGDVAAILAYVGMVLESSAYPDGFPERFSLGYEPRSKILVVEYELPTISVVPEVSEVKYVKARDRLSATPMKSAERAALYREVLASVALRTIHEIFESDQGGHCEVCCFNGYVNTIDPATGRDVSPHLISVRVTKDQFRQIDLRRVNKAACLRNLGSQVSRNPDEAVPVRPIMDFDMVDPRFVDQQNVVRHLDSRTNLMDLTPTEFEHLVANLFAGMGLESKLTRSSRDGGVDCIAYDPRPVLGGKVVIQAKRYRNTVGVSAVRDLYGTMLNEGASKGILVTTSGYGPDAFEFAKDKPIELIDGGGLLFLLGEQGVTARIVFPES